MKLLPLSAGLLLCVALAAWHGPPRSDASDLVGTWQVDLRPAPDAAPYDKTFVVTSVDGDSLQGMFYDTPITHGRINTDWGAVHFAFTTSDGSGTYHHAGRLDGERMEGLSHSLGRGFVLPWRARRVAE